MNVTFLAVEVYKKYSLNDIIVRPGSTSVQ